MTVPGFSLLENVLTLNISVYLCRLIELELSRVPAKTNENSRSRIIRFGYDYTEKKTFLKPLPDWFWMPRLENTFDSVTINEYQPGHSIAPHIDSTKFDDPIAILSLLSPATMVLHPPLGDTVDVLLPARSLAILSGEVRYQWKHSIRPVDKLRYSVVYRIRK